MQTLTTCPMCLEKIFKTRSYDTNPNSNMPGWTNHHCFLNKSIAICDACGGGFTFEYLSDVEISNFYDNIYTAQYSSNNLPKVTGLNELNPRFFSQAMYLKSFIQLYDGMRMLEIGPNVISVLPALSIFCTPKYFYFDQVESPIIKSYGGRRLGNYASAENILKEFSTGEIDLVYSSHSLEHINPSSLESMFYAFSQVTSNGGYLFFEVPDDFGYQGVFPPHTLFFTENSIRRLVERYDFDILDLSRWDGGARWGGAGNCNTIKGGSKEYTNDRITIKYIMTRFRTIFIRKILGNAIVYNLIKPLLLRYALPRALRRIPTPYDTIPFYRLLARRKYR